MEYNVRERAEIVALAIQSHQELSAQPLIDWFELKLARDEQSINDWLAYKKGLMNEAGYNEEDATSEANKRFGDIGKI